MHLNTHKPELTPLLAGFIDVRSHKQMLVPNNTMEIYTFKRLSPTTTLSQVRARRPTQKP